MDANTQLVQQSEIQKIATGTNEVLTQNINSVENAKSAGQALIATIREKGMNEELDQQCNNFLVKVKRTLALIQERRKPITQLFDQVKKHFTTLENDLDPDKGEVYITVQKFRNDYARAKAEEARRREEEARRKLEAEKERAAIAEKVEVSLTGWLNNFLVQVLRDIHEVYNKVTLENYFDSSEAIANFSETYPGEHLGKFDPQLHLVYSSQEEATEIINQVSLKIMEKFPDEYSEKVRAEKEKILELLPGRKQELEAIAEAEKKNKAEAERMKKEAEEREKAEKERLEKEAAEREKKAGEDAARKKQEAEMNGLFNATQAMTPEESSAQVRKSWVIEVMHQAAFVQIFQLWFEREGGKLPMDKLERKTLGQMKKFCEGLAREGEQIDSPYIKYKEDFKAVAKS